MEYQVVVCAYDESWPQEFAQEAQRLREVLGENCLEIHHIGSTAVPGLAAKPIIDFMLVVRELEEVDRRASALEELGYEYLGEFGIPGRRYLRKGGFRHTHHLHIFSTFNKAAIERHLAVREYLRANLEAALEYAQLKLEAAKIYHDYQSYSQAKDEYVRALERRALEWRAQRP